MDHKLSEIKKYTQENYLKYHEIIDTTAIEPIYNILINKKYNYDYKFGDIIHQYYCAELLVNNSVEPATRFVAT